MGLFSCQFDQEESPLSFTKFGKTKKIPRSKDVELHVRQVTLLPDSDDSRPYIEIREYIKTTGIYGHGIVIPLGLVDQVVAAVESLASVKAEVVR